MLYLCKGIPQVQIHTANKHAQFSLKEFPNKYAQSILHEFLISHHPPPWSIAYTFTAAAKSRSCVLLSFLHELHVLFRSIIKQISDLACMDVFEIS